MAQTHPEGGKFFLSHSSGDDDVVRRLREALADLDAPVSIDSREFHGGDPLEGTIRRAIGRSAGVLILVSPRSHGSAWVGKELKHALVVQKERGGAEAFPVVPLLLDATPLGAFEALFDEAPIHVELRSDSLDSALHDILVGLRLRLPTDAEATPQPAIEAVEELLLELGDPSIVTRADGSRRARARARLVHVPATAGQREVHSTRFTLEAPLGVIEATDLRWYLEDYAVWPSPMLAERAQRIEGQLESWGRLLHDTALPVQHVSEVLKSWSAAAALDVARRFSIEVDATADAGTPDDAVQALREAGTSLLGLPWELMHDGRSFLFQGARPVRVRRRLPTEHAVPAQVLSTPVRVLLVSPRPEDDACGYFDHRSSARPLVDAMEALAGQVELRLLAPPTLSALREELDRARSGGRPYHVLHFDGHGVYDPRAGLGALCFEHEEDGELAIGGRRHATIPTPELGALLRDHGIPLVFLEACQTAQAERAGESVASALLKTGVGSVVAMTHSVLVETARRFVEAFYRSLCSGERVGSAMLAAQRELKDRPVRGRVFGYGEFKLQDWFVPVLYQDRDDPQLFRRTPPRQALENWKGRLKKRLGELPPEPAQGFVGRSRELLALERLLAVRRYAVLRGQGGEGKTALAAEFARWRVRARQIRRAAFVSVESHGHVQAVLDAIGRQLVGESYSVATYSTLDAAIEPVARELREQSTLLVIDNLESVLAAPFAVADPAGARSPGGARDAAHEAAGDALAADDRERAQAILGLAARLLDFGDTRLVFTSREALPAPFDGELQRIELHRLSRQDAVELVERTLGLDAAGKGREAEARREDIESLVEAVHGHARTLALLAPSLRERGPAATQVDLVALMSDMERRFPGEREKSLLASLELSLRRLTPELRERVNVLSVFHGAVDLDMLRTMMAWEDADVATLGQALVATGLATDDGYRHLSLNPALCPYLAANLDPAEREALAVKWTEAMGSYAYYLLEERSRNIEMASSLVVMDLPNLMALLDRVEQADDPRATLELSARLSQMLNHLGRPRSLARIGQARDAALVSAGETAWSRANVEAERTRIDVLRVAGRLEEAFVAARKMHARVLEAGADAYEGADYDTAMAWAVLGTSLSEARGAGNALAPLEEARRQFEAVEAKRPGCGAARMVAVTISQHASALLHLGRLSEAAQGYETAIALAEQLEDQRALAVRKAQLGAVRLAQRRHSEALAAFVEALDRFTELGEIGAIATSWHQIGMVHQGAGNGEAAEDAYHRSLAIEVQRNNVRGQAVTLNQLGLLHVDLLGRPEEAVALIRQSVDRYVEMNDREGQGRTRNNLASLLLQLGHVAEARHEIELAIEARRDLGHSGELWKSWSVLHLIERATGRTAEAGRASLLARDAFLAYRRDGGQNPNPGGPMVEEIGRFLVEGRQDAAREQLRRWSEAPDPPSWLAPLVVALQAIVDGVRSPSIAVAAELDYDDSAEVQLLLERLGSSAPAGQ